MRKSGILLPISALPSDYGIGTVGKSAYDFVDFLHDCGQSYWQILPINPTSFGNSPYQSFSAFAFNPYFIDFDFLVQQGLLKKGECDEYFFGSDKTRIDYTAIYESRPKILEKAAERFDKSDLGYRKFCSKNKFWLDDYAFFMALKEKYRMKPLSEFPEKVKMRDTLTLYELKNELDARIGFHKITQFLFFRQWSGLMEYAKRKNIKIIGDIPIYVSADSADVWAYRELFSLTKECAPKEVAGCPPDNFSPDGQLWGNPLYDWGAHERDGYKWWLRRFSQSSALFDAVRIDHFRGFYSYYSVPAGASTARHGEWKNANGEALMKKVKENFPALHIIAEDLGFITDDVQERMASSGFPGMKILQFAFDCNDSEHLPHNYTKNSVVYTGTHDNDTLMGYILSAPKEEIDFAADYLGVHSTKNLHSAIIRCALASVCETAIIPMWDYLRQGSDKRINTPSTVGDNWIYRIEREDIDDNLKDKIYRLTKLYSRL